MKEILSFLCLQFVSFRFFVWLVGKITIPINYQLVYRADMHTIIKFFGYGQAQNENIQSEVAVGNFTNVRRLD